MTLSSISGFACFSVVAFESKASSFAGFDSEPPLSLSELLELEELDELEDFFFFFLLPLERLLRRRLRLLPLYHCVTRGSSEGPQTESTKQI